MMDHLSLYKGFGSFLILSFTSSSVRCGVTRVILPMIFSLSLTHDGLCKESYYRRQGGISQCLVWEKLVTKIADIHPLEPDAQLSDSALSGRRAALGYTGLQELMQARCVVIANPDQMPSAFLGRYRLMAIDGTVFNTADTKANSQAFGRSSNQYGPGAYPQVRCVLLVECGTHAVVGLQTSRYDVSEVHSAHQLLNQIGPDTLLLVDAGITGGVCLALFG